MITLGQRSGWGLRRQGTGHCSRRARAADSQEHALSRLTSPCAAHTAANSAARESVLDEVRRMSEQAKGSSELLNDLLVSRTEPGGCGGLGEWGEVKTACAGG